MQSKKQTGFCVVWFESAPNETFHGSLFNTRVCFTRQHKFQTGGNK